MKQCTYDCYVGVLVRSELAALASLKMATALGQTVLASQVYHRLGIPSRVYNLDVTNKTIALTDLARFTTNASRPLFGLTLVAGNVPASLQLARWLKLNTEGDVIVGGPEVTHETAPYYANNPSIDAAFVGHAERCITTMLQEGIKVPLPNLYTKSRLAPLIIDAPLDPDGLWVNYELVYRLTEDHQGVSYLWAGDCRLARPGHRRCYFCARARNGRWHRRPSTVWEELRSPLQHGLSRFYNTADSVGVYPFSELLTDRPSEFRHTTHKMFINAVEVTPRRARTLHELRAWAAVGIESMSNLGAAHKGRTTVADNRRAIEIFAQHDVPMVLTFVHGLPGETYQTLSANARQVGELVDRYGNSIVMVTVSPLLVTIGSTAFDEMVGSSPSSWHGNKTGAYYDPLPLSEEYVARHCGVTRRDLIESIAALRHDIVALHPHIEFDSKGISPDEKRYIAQ